MPWSGGESRVKNDVEWTGTGWRGVNGENKVDGFRVEGINGGIGGHL